MLNFFSSFDSKKIQFSFWARKGIENLARIINRVCEPFSHSIEFKRMLKKVYAKKCSNADPEEDFGEFFGTKIEELLLIIKENYEKFKSD